MSYECYECLGAEIQDLMILAHIFFHAGRKVKGI